MLSAGQRRRTALAILVARRARLWLLDEPHAALDTAGMELLDSVLAELRGTANALPAGVRPVGTNGRRVRGFDASEGTDRDPLKNKTFDLTNPKNVPDLKQP